MSVTSYDDDYYSDFTNELPPIEVVEDEQPQPQQRQPTAGNVASWLEFAQRPWDQGGLGLPAHQAVGVVANLIHESGQNIDPNVRPGDNGTAFGAAQWRHERAEGLMSLPDWKSTPTQQKWMRMELMGPERKAFEALKNAPDAKSATDAFNRLYERSADPGHGRRATAEKLFRNISQVVGNAQPPAPAPAPEELPPIEAWNGVPVPGTDMLPEITVTPTDPAGAMPSTGVSPPYDMEAGMRELSDLTANPRPTSILDILEKSTRGVRQVARGAVGPMTEAPWMIGAGLASLPTMGNANPVTDFLLDRAAKQSQFNDAITGLTNKPPSNIVEKAGRFVGDNITPVGKYTAAASGISMAVNGLVSTAEAARKKKSAPEMEPGQIVDGTTPPSGDSYVIEAAPGQFAVIPKSSIYGRMSLPEDFARKQFERTGMHYGVFNNPDAAHVYAQSIRDRVTHTVDTAGGPANVKAPELRTLGGMAAATIGMIFAPKLYRAFKNNLLPTSAPKMRSVPDSAPGTVDFTTRTDLARTYDDANAGMLRVAQRSGMDPVAHKQIADTFKIQTRSAASAIADSAYANGRADSVNFTFRAKVPLMQLQKMDNAETSRYLHLKDTFDDLQLVKTQPGNAPGQSVVRGMTEAQVLAEINAMERANPELAKFGAAYKDNLQATRKFEATGEYSTLSAQEYVYLNGTRPNTVPFKGERTEVGAQGALNPASSSQGSLDTSKRVLGENLDRGQATAALAQDMRERLRFRMENEAKGIYVDNMRKQVPDSFVRVSPEELRDNPHWKKNTVEFYRRGKKETYTTAPFLADVLRLDPYYFQNGAANIMYTSKRMFEAQTTGVLAPWFAVTNMLRSQKILRVTAGTQGLAGPNILQTVAAIPRQLGALSARAGAESMDHGMGKAIADSLDRGSGGWLTSVLGPGFTNAMSARLATVYNDSLYAKLQQVGGTHVSFSDTMARTQTTNILQGAIESTKGTTRAFIEGYKNLLNSAHNAPSYAMVSKNLGKEPLPELAATVRSLTGDPRVSGQFSTANGPIRFNDAASGFGGQFLTDTVKTYGAVSEFGRTSIPWFNATEQGAKAIASAYWKNPAKFAAGMWAYNGLPAAAGVFWNRAQGNDPNGMSYLEYQMNGRSPYNALMFQYIAIPGRPAEEGIEIPTRFHETAAFSRMMEIGLDHAFRSSTHSERDDFMDLAANAVKTVFSPSMPPVANLALAHYGMKGPQSVIEGDAYRPRQEAFDQTGGLPVSIDLYTKALSGGLADVMGAGAAAFVQANGWEKPGAFVAEALKRAASKTPVVRDMFDVKPPASGVTRDSEEMFRKNRAIKQLGEFYKSKGLTGEKELGADARSKSGGAIATEALGNPVPREIVGLAQPEPTNPLYKMFAEETYSKFMQDSKGGTGFQSLWKRYNDATQQLQSLRNINAGNYVTWQKRLETLPEQQAFLEENRIDSSDPRAVKNFYERIRQSAVREIAFTIKKVETEFSERLGKPVKIEDLDPYGKPAQ